MPLRQLLQAGSQRKCAKSIPPASPTAECKMTGLASRMGHQALMHSTFSSGQERLEASRIDAGSAELQQQPDKHGRWGSPADHAWPGAPTCLP